ncbi:hypothetical protein NPIL_546771, partial [Nephila pilipes]
MKPRSHLSTAGRFGDKMLLIFTCVSCLEIAAVSSGGVKSKIEHLQKDLVTEIWDTSNSKYMKGKDNTIDRKSSEIFNPTSRAAQWFEKSEFEEMPIQFGRSDFLISTPRFGRTSFLIPAPQIGRSDYLIPIPLFGKSNTLIPVQQNGRLNYLIPTPRIGRSDYLIPTPRIGRSDYLIPTPRIRRSD